MTKDRNALILRFLVSLHPVLAAGVLVAGLACSRNDPGETVPAFDVNPSFSLASCLALPLNYEELPYLEGYWNVCDGDWGIGEAPTKGMGACFSCLSPTRIIQIRQLQNLLLFIEVTSDHTTLHQSLLRQERVVLTGCIMDSGTLRVFGEFDEGAALPQKVPEFPAVFRQEAIVFQGQPFARLGQSRLQKDQQTLVRRARDPNADGSELDSLRERFLRLRREAKPCIERYGAFSLRRCVEDDSKVDDWPRGRWESCGGSKSDHFNVLQRGHLSLVIRDAPVPNLLTYSGSAVYPMCQRGDRLETILECSGEAPCLADLDGEQYPSCIETWRMVNEGRFEIDQTSVPISCIESGRECLAEREQPSRTYMRPR